jgi:uncharacterized protein YkwD
VSVILVIAVAWLFLLVLALAILRAAALGDRADAHAARRRARARRTTTAARARRSRTVFLTSLALCASAAALGATADDASARSCAARSNANATVCLINAQRRAHGLVPLRANARLARAAVRHARDMVARSYFSHVSPAGASFVDRLRAVGYASRSCAWSGGETLAWGSGILQSPASRVRAWMNSPAHRAILLGAGFREVGIGIAAGSPANASVGSTYVGEFGRRRC